MRFRLRTLLLVTAITPLLVGGGIRAYWAYEHYAHQGEREALIEEVNAFVRQAKVGLTQDPELTALQARSIMYNVQFFPHYENSELNDRLAGEIFDVLGSVQRMQEHEASLRDIERWRCWLSEVPDLTPSNSRVIVRTSCRRFASP